MTPVKITRTQQHCARIATQSLTENGERRPTPRRARFVTRETEHPAEPKEDRERQLWEGRGLRCSSRLLSPRRSLGARSVLSFVFCRADCRRSFRSLSCEGAIPLAGVSSYPPPSMQTVVRPYEGGELPPPFSLSVFWTVGEVRWRAVSRIALKYACRLKLLRCFESILARSIDWIGHFTGRKVRRKKRKKEEKRDGSTSASITKLPCFSMNNVQSTSL